MKVRVKFQLGDQAFEEDVEGKDATEVLKNAKSRLMKRLGWKGLFLSPLSPLMFAQEAVRRYNDHFHANYELPQTAEDFVRIGVQAGSLILLES